MLIWATASGPPMDADVVAPNPNTPAKGSGCPTSAVFTLLGRPFSMDVLYALLRAKKAMRFADLQNAIPTTPGTLSERLKELAAAGLITRTPFAEVPPRVEYSLTTMGSSLDPIFDAIEAWAKTYPLPES